MSIGIPVRSALVKWGCVLFCVFLFLIFLKRYLLRPVGRTCSVPLMNFADYQSISAMNWSTLKKGVQSMRHLKHAIDSDDDGDTFARAVLRLNHAAVLEPHTVERDYAVFPGPTRRGKEWDAFQAANPGKTFVKQDDIDESRRIADAVMSCKPARDLLEGALREQNLVWTDDETQLLCKGRMDIYKPGAVIADLKGCKSVEASAFVRHVGSYLYYAQAAWYQAGVEALYHARLPFFLVCYETTAPYDVAVYEVDEDWLRPGRELTRRLMSQFAACLKSGVWPGRYDTVQALPTPPKYINPDVEDFEFSEES